MVNFIYEWNGKGQYAWSGTPYGIYTALRKKVEVNNIDIPFGKAYRILEKIKGKLLYGDSFGVLSTRRGERFINNCTEVQNGVPSIMFVEYKSKCIQDSYSYQDLTVDYVSRLIDQKPEMRPFTPAMFANERAISERKEMVASFYSECKGCFTMSKWLASDMINNSNISPDKVHFIGGVQP